MAAMTQNRYVYQWSGHHANILIVALSLPFAVSLVLALRNMSFWSMLLAGSLLVTAWKIYSFLGEMRQKQIKWLVLNGEKSKARYIKTKLIWEIDGYTWAYYLILVDSSTGEEVRSERVYSSSTYWYPGLGKKVTQLVEKYIEKGGNFFIYRNSGAKNIYFVDTKPFFDFVKINLAV